MPANVRVTRFVPYDLALSHARAFVTNGGYTGVTLALANGVPLVQAGTTEEKVEIAARIRYSGVGLALGTTRPTSRAIADGVRRVLTEPGFAAAAGRLRDEMAEQRRRPGGRPPDGATGGHRAPVLHSEGVGVGVAES